MPTGFGNAARGDEPPAERGEAYLLSLFVGPRAEKFLPARVLVDKEASGALPFGERFKLGLRTFNWAAFFLGFVWFFYRKLYLEGALLVLVPMLLAYLFPAVTGPLIPALAGAIGAMANRYYVDRAKRKIARIEAEDQPPRVRDFRIRQAGGVTAAGGAVGGALLASLLFLATLPAILGGYGGLPACDTAAVKDLTERVLAEVQNRDPQHRPFTPVAFEQTAADPEAGTRDCTARVQVENRTLTVDFRLEWEDRAAGRYRLSMNGIR